MAETDVEVIRELHRHYERGDMDGVARYLHPRVNWRDVANSLVDCHDRNDVLGVLKERLEWGVPPLETLELTDLGDEVLVGLPQGPPWSSSPAFFQRVTVRDGVLIEIQDYASREAALSGVTERPA